MEYKWVLGCDYDEEIVDNIARELAVPPVMARILLNREIDSFDKAYYYFRPDLENLHDPFLMDGMDRAVERLHKALHTGENILIYGDYDVDGVSSAAILYLVMSRMVGSKISYYIPDRMTEGYGLSSKSIHEAAENEVSLIVTVDCGVTAVDEIKLANELGMDTIVCDHHQPAEELPPAVAILDPKLPDSNYPFKELAGVGVAFKLLQGLYKKLGLSEAELDEYLDLVAIGSCADIVPLVDENRILVRHGMDKINYNPRFGVRALLESSGLNSKEITAGLIVFVLAPRINAVGRLGDARRAVQLFSAPTLQQARLLARELEKENRLRRDIDEITFREAREILETRLDPREDKAFVLYKNDWHPGVIGIVASRIVEKYYRPTIMITVIDGIGKGSARSIANFNIYQAIKECSHLLSGFGGHKYAAGLTIEAEKIPEFVKCFKEAAAEQLVPEDLIPCLKIDGEIDISEFNPRFIRLLKLMGPFGPMNNRPVFRTRNLKIVGNPSVVGQNHLKLKVEQDGVVMDAIGFNMADYLGRIGNNGFVDCVYVVEENRWNGKNYLQLRLKDIR
ncbi:MAG: single-stranded-DNA-specific exonuclease RecJ [Calditrichaeota bacterium]|nr:single-stranded-DNA-specific exonuclease RecJ [Calditrichota bacterium]RQV92610.1 MAG: single-stranded-DNA-specific exonuclease RecJ [bacterium]RQV99842.1 MAG: single-stranded-DNA-specific exonuclease RecJ [Calditrichota bacterium]